MRQRAGWVLVLAGIVGAVLVLLAPAGTPNWSPWKDRVQPAAQASTEPAAPEPGNLVAIEQIGEPDLLPARQVASIRRQARAGDRISIPALGAVMPIKPSPTRRGRLLVPPGVRAVGWATSTASPTARRGVTLLATHRDTAGAGRGVRSPLYDMETLRQGDVIVLVWHGKRTRFTVDRVVRVRGVQVPPEVMDRSTRPHRLALLTCGGPLRVGKDRVAHWSRRILVWSTAV